MNKVVMVRAHFAPIYREVKVKVPTGEKKKGLFGGEKDVKTTEVRHERQGVSDCVIDSARLATDLDETIASLNEQGYEIVSVTPVTSGSYRYATDTGTIGPNAGFGWGYGYGYSYTSSLLVTARKV